MAGTGNAGEIWPLSEFGGEGHRKIKPEFQRELLAYGELAQATYDAFEKSSYSNHFGDPYWPSENLIDNVLHWRRDETLSIKADEGFAEMHAKGEPYTDPNYIYADPTLYDATDEMKGPKRSPKDPNYADVKKAITDLKCGVELEDLGNAAWVGFITVREFKPPNVGKGAGAKKPDDGEFEIVVSFRGTVLGDMLELTGEWATNIFGAELDKPVYDIVWPKDLEATRDKLPLEKRDLLDGDKHKSKEEELKEYLADDGFKRYKAENEGLWFKRVKPESDAYNDRLLKEGRKYKATLNPQKQARVHRGFGDMYTTRPKEKTKTKKKREEEEAAKAKKDLSSAGQPPAPVPTPTIQPVAQGGGGGGGGRESTIDASGEKILGQEPPASDPVEVVKEGVERRTSEEERPDVHKLPPQSTGKDGGAAAGGSASVSQAADAKSKKDSSEPPESWWSKLYGAVSTGTRWAGGIILYGASYATMPLTPLHPAISAIHTGVKFAARAATANPPKRERSVYPTQAKLVQDLKDDKYIAPAETVYLRITRLLKEMKNKKCRKITFTGHSLGGALATLAAFHIKVAQRAALDPTVPWSPDTTIQAITFSAPNVGNKEFRKLLETLDVRVLNVINRWDFVPLLPGVTNLVGAHASFFWGQDSWWLRGDVGPIRLPDDWFKGWTDSGWSLPYDHDRCLDEKPIKIFRDEVGKSFGLKHGLEGLLYMVATQYCDKKLHRPVAFLNKGANLLNEEIAKALNIPPNWWHPVANSHLGLFSSTVKGYEGALVVLHQGHDASEEHEISRMADLIKGTWVFRRSNDTSQWGSQIAAGGGRGI